MDCPICCVSQIGPSQMPNHGYFCSNAENAHLQCRECNNRAEGKCLVCGEETKLILLSYPTSDKPTEKKPDCKEQETCMHHE